jgi:hypothetical protein
MSAVFPVKPGESLGEISTAVEFLDDLHGFAAQWSMSFPLRRLVLSLEIIPTLVDDLPEW